MKTFNDLEWKNRPEFTFRPGMTKQGTTDLGRGLTISVMDGLTHYSDPGESYEVAVLHGGNMLTLGESDQVLAYQTAHEIELLMMKIQMDDNYVKTLKERI